jgi:hypothetical protein
MSDFLSPLPQPPLGSFGTFLFPSSPQGFVDPALSAESPDNPTPGKTGPVALQVDVISSEAPEWTGQLSQNPLEKGGTVSDNNRILPRKLTMTCTISDAEPLEPRQGTIPLGGNAKFDALQYLDAKFQAGQPFDFISGLAVYETMCMTRLVVDRRAETGRAAKFTVTLEQAIIVSSQLVGIDPANVSPGAANSAATPTDLGTQVTTPDTGSTQSSAIANLDNTKSILPRVGS